MNYAVDRESIVNGILQGYGEARIGPFSPDRRASPTGPQYKLGVDGARLSGSRQDGGFQLHLAPAKDMVRTRDHAGLASQLGRSTSRSISVPRVERGAAPRSEFEMAVNAWESRSRPTASSPGCAGSARTASLREPAGRRAINKAGIRRARAHAYQDADRLLRGDAVGLFTCEVRAV